MIIHRSGDNDTEAKLLFTGDRPLRRWSHAADLATANGDEHATEVSQTWLALDECPSIAASPAYVDGSHFKMILGDDLHRLVLEALRHETRDSAEILAASAEFRAPCRASLQPIAATPR